MVEWSNKERSSGWGGVLIIVDSVDRPDTFEIKCFFVIVGTLSIRKKIFDLNDWRLKLSVFCK